MIPAASVWGVATAFVSIFVIGLLATVFWFWMLIDLMKRKKFDDKLVWAVVLIFLNIVGAIMYFFMVYKEKPRK